MTGKSKVDDLSNRLKELGKEIVRLKKLAKTLRESGDLYKTVFDNAGDAIFVHAMGGRFLEVNPAACEQAGYSREELLTLSPEDISGVGQEELAARMGRIKKEGRFSGEEIHVRKDGASLEVELNSRLVTFGGKPAVLTIARDITERMRAEVERTRLESQLQKAERMEAIANLAGGIAHQFNNALSPISLTLDLFEMDLPEHSQSKKYLKAMRASADRLAKLTKQLLAYARGGKYRAMVISMSHFVRETLPLIEHTIKPSITVETDIPDNMWGVEADFTQLQMALSAVLSNASEAIEKEGRIRISCRNETVKDPVFGGYPDFKPGPYVSLTVEDNGIGMDNETKRRIFEPFFTTQFRGRGLGMAATYGIIKNHGGWIFIDSELNRGTTVKIFIPARKSRNKNTKAAARQSFSGVGTVLLIEDEEMVMDISRTLLERLGFSVLSARDGKEALHLARTYGDDIQIAILDVGLPDMNGKTIYPLLTEACPGLKTIVCSGFAIDGPAQEILDAGARGFIQKPFSLSELSETLNRILKRR